MEIEFCETENNTKILFVLILFIIAIDKLKRKETNLLDASYAVLLSKTEHVPRYFFKQFKIMLRARLDQGDERYYSHIDIWLWNKNFACK